MAAQTFEEYSVDENEVTACTFYQALPPSQLFLDSSGQTYERGARHDSPEFERHIGHCSWRAC